MLFMLFRGVFSNLLYSDDILWNTDFFSRSSHWTVLGLWWNDVGRKAMPNSFW